MGFSIDRARNRRCAHCRASPAAEPDGAARRRTIELGVPVVPEPGVDDTAFLGVPRQPSCTDARVRSPERPECCPIVNIARRTSHLGYLQRRSSVRASGVEIITPERDKAADPGW